jgi:hypothetical protein
MASTNSTDFWTGLRDNITGLAVDYARARYVDVERPDDDKNMPDKADLRYWGFADDGTGLVSAPGGVPLLGWAMIAGAAILGAILLKRAL